MYIFLKKHDGKWDSVSQKVFENRKIIVDENCDLKYSGDWITVEGNTFMSEGQIDIDELLKIMRFINKKIPDHSYTTLVDEPEVVQIFNRNVMKLLYVKTGKIFREC